MKSSPHSYSGPDRPDLALTGRRGFLGGLLATAALAAAGAAPAHAAARSAVPLATRPLLLGTYTSEAGGGTGIGAAAYDTATGALTPGPVITGVDNPSYLALHPSGCTVYAVAEQDAGAVTAVGIAPDGAYEVLGSRSTGGSGTTHLSVHPSGRWLLSADYGSGSVAVHPIAEDGSLGERTDLLTHSSPPPGPGASEELKTEMLELNLAYQERFGHVFLICATGATGEQMRDAVKSRIGNSPEQEQEIVRTELGKINRIRLTRLVTEALAEDAPAQDS
ncbi:hypothetical protein SBADM41S_08186 [Streptomyces badius]